MCQSVIYVVASGRVLRAVSKTWVCKDCRVFSVEATWACIGLIMQVARVWGFGLWRLWGLKKGFRQMYLRRILGLVLRKFTDRSEVV